MVNLVHKHERSSGKKRREVHAHLSLERAGGGLSLSCSFPRSSDVFCTSDQKRVFMEQRLLHILRQRPVLCDGAIGTLLYARGIPYERCFDELNLSQPEMISAIHREYITAGAEIIETNSFGANCIRLAPYNLESGLPPGSRSTRCHRQTGLYRRGCGSDRAASAGT
jgi:hypothetical protein